MPISPPLTPLPQPVAAGVALEPVYLLALRTAQELSTQDVIERFALDKSAASRHLRQLVAPSLIEERRVDGAKKVYQVNKKAVDELIEFLIGLG